MNKKNSCNTTLKYKLHNFILEKNNIHREIIVNVDNILFEYDKEFKDYMLSKTVSITLLQLYSLQ